MVSPELQLWFPIMWARVEAVTEPEMHAAP